MNRKLILAIPVVITALAAAAGLIYYEKYRHVSLPPQYYNHRSSPAAKVPDLDHVVLIVMENHSLNGVIGNQDAPYLNKLANEYSLAANYYSTAHPSLPNYIQLTSGTNAGIISDCNPPRPGCQASVKNIADQIENSGRSWKEYAESMPAPCTLTNYGRYAVKHNPFAYYPDITDNTQRCRSHIVPLTQLYANLAADKLPNYSFIMPNMCSDTHDCPLSTGDKWLSDLVPKILGSKAFQNKESLLVVTWDEGAGLSNHIATILAGPAVKRGFMSQQYYSHYSLLATIEKSWNLPPLTSMSPGRH